MKKIYALNDEAKLKIKSGIDKVANAVKLSLGPSGRNAIIGRPFNDPLFTNDGITIAKEMCLDDEIEQLGLETVRTALKSANDMAGDGTTTTTVLLQAIMEEGFKRLEGGLLGKQDPMAVRKDIQEACILVLEKLKTEAIPISTLEELIRVATISVESPQIGALIAQMFHDLGKDALITAQDGFNLDIETETIKGSSIEAGLISPYLANNEKGEYTEFNPLILVTTTQINNIEDITPIIIKTSEGNRKTLVVVAEQFSKDMINSFVSSKISGVFTVIPIKAPTTSKSYLLEDLAISLGTKLLTDNISTLEVSDLGTCDRVVVGKDKTLLFGTKGDTSSRVKELQTEMKTAESLYDRDKLQKRIGKMSGIGVIKVGASTDAERDYLKLKIEDAINATRCALEEGVVKGGGLTLMEIANSMDVNILTEALKAPYNQIQKNAGGKLEIGADVIDPVKVTRTCLEKACSVAGLVITTEIAIADKKEEPKDYKTEE